MNNTWDDYLEEYASYLKEKYSRYTVINYLQHMKYFIAKHETSSPLEISAKDIQDYVDSLYSGETFTKGSSMSIMVGVKAFFRYLFKQRYIHTNPVRNIKMHGTSEPKLPTTLTDKEIRALIKACELDPQFMLKDKAMIETLYGTGITTGELINLKIQDIDFEEEYIKVHKGKKTRCVPMTGKMCDALLVYMHHRKKQKAQKGSEEYAFLSGRGKKMGTTSVIMAIDDLQAKAGIKKKIFGYCFRYSYMYVLLQKGVEMRTVRKLCGLKFKGCKDYNPKLSYLKKIIKSCHPRS